MASAQAMEEELQQSVLLSEEGAEYETADTGADGSTINAASHLSDRDMASSGEKSSADEDYDSFSDRDASGEEVDEDAEGEVDNTYGNQKTAVSGARRDDDDDDVDDDEDAEGDDDDGEGVGAVKIKPGDSEDEDEESDVSEPPRDGDEESEDEEGAAWDGADGADEEDDDSETGPTNTCAFCKQDEEHDPSEDFEAFLTCQGCGDNG